MKLTKVTAKQRDAICVAAGHHTRHGQGGQTLLQVGEHWMLVQDSMAKLLRKAGTNTRIEGDRLIVTMEDVPSFEATLVLQEDFARIKEILE